MIRFEQDNKFHNEKTVSLSCDKLDMNLVRESLREYQCIKVNIRGDVFYCFEENYPDHMNIDFALEELSRLDTLSLRQFWNGKIEGIIFDGCNEWVIQLFDLLVKEGINVKVEGRIWEIINGKAFYFYKGNNVKNVRTIEKNQRLYKEFYFVMDILQFNRYKAMNLARDYYFQMGVHAFICTIPEYEDLEKHTISESQRNQAGVVITGRVDITNPDVAIHFQRVYGEEWKVIRKKCTTEVMEHWLRAIDDEEYYLKNRKIYSHGRNRCYLIGPCIIEGKTAPSGKSFPDMVQKNLDRIFADKYAVMTISIPFYVVGKYLEILKYLSIRSNDMVICIDEVSQNCIECYKGAWGKKPDINFKDIYEERLENEEWFADKPIHTSVFANKKLASFMVGQIKNKMEIRADNLLLQVGKGCLLKDEVAQIDEYIKSMDKFRLIDVDQKSIGAIVMNCNPLTLGHRYLIDYASSKVDYLYIFVVEEDKSYISFKDRLELVKRYADGKENIKVNPSGKLILSAKTLPMYFEKEERKEIVIDAWKDLEIFAQYIAPKLHISIRFVGEEKTDYITWQYNREMERTLEDYGLQLWEVPRQEIDGEIISASAVRRYMKEKKWEKVEKLVSKDTCEYLFEKYGN